ncbi:MAG: hypothetical protein IKG94_06455, partial [Candidatus Methanomethylophilaceae archaeon]|nr:hypothetical protein [Candidatus Methanomethylophilaceae archaeon]
ELNRQYFSELSNDEVRAIRKVSYTAVGKVLQVQEDPVKDGTPYYIRLGSFSDVQNDQGA